MGLLDGIFFRSGPKWKDRTEAGNELASVIREQMPDVGGKGVVLGLPRGGIVVAKAVAERLGLPLDFRAVKKVGHPIQPEFAIGAVDISGTSVRNPFVQPSEMPLDSEYEAMVAKALDEAVDMEFDLSGDNPSRLPGSDWCLIVDDGAATGLTILAVVKGLKSEGYGVYVAVPVTSVQAKNILEKEADGFYTIDAAEDFRAVGQYYENFSQVSTQEARAILSGE